MWLGRYGSGPASCQRNPTDDNGDQLGEFALVIEIEAQVVAMVAPIEIEADAERLRQLSQLPEVQAMQDCSQRSCTRSSAQTFSWRTAASSRRLTNWSPAEDLVREHAATLGAPTALRMRPIAPAMLSQGMRR